MKKALFLQTRELRGRCFLLYGAKIKEIALLNTVIRKEDEVSAILNISLI